MVEIDVYSINKDFGFIEFVETFVGRSMEEAEKMFPGKILRIVGVINMKSVKQAWKDELKKSTEQQAKDFEAKLMLAAGSIQKGVKSK